MWHVTSALNETKAPSSHSCSMEKEGKPFCKQHKEFVKSPKSTFGPDTENNVCHFSHGEESLEPIVLPKCETGDKNSTKCWIRDSLPRKTHVGGDAKLQIAQQADSSESLM